MSIINEILPYLIPILVIQLGLQIYCIINLVRRRKVRFNNKLLWGCIIVLPGILGPVVYLVFRGEDQ